MGTEPGLDLGPRFEARYRPLRSLGRGAMGEVWLVERREDRLPLACKALRAADLSDRRARFEREFDALRQLAHPHVVSVVERGEHGATAWLMMEYVPGGTLADAIAAARTLSLERAARVAADVLSGLAACHARDILHRDLKPANVLLTAGGRAKLADLGLARDEKRVTLLTATGALLGTPLYMAPEVLIDGEPWSPAGDVYAVAAMLYEMLAGAPPVPATTIPDIVEALERPWVPVAARMPEVPPAVAGLLDRALCRRPAQRIASAARLLDELLAAVPAASMIGGAQPVQRIAQVRATVIASPDGLAAPAVCTTALGVPAGVLAERGPAALPPELARRYAPERLIGEGATGQVWLAWQVELDRPVALKLLHPHLIADSASVRRFGVEARTVAALTHPLIVRILDHGVLGGAPFIVYEYLPGRSLREVLRAGALPVPIALSIALHVAEALGAAHAAGVLHRDVKPENLVEVEPGTYKLIDFGIARSAAGPAVTSSGALIGTPAYLAPELVAGEPPSPASDLYALGVMIFEMLCGRPPFEDHDPVALMRRHLAELPPNPRSLRPDLAPEVEALTMRLLAKSPLDRYRSAQALATALARRVGAVVAAEASVVAEPTRLPAPAGSAPVTVLQARWTPALATVVLALALALLKLVPDHAGAWGLLTVLFGLCLEVLGFIVLFGAGQRALARQPALRIDAHGIDDMRGAALRVEWSNVRGVHVAARWAIRLELADPAPVPSLFRRPLLAPWLRVGTSVFLFTGLLATSTAELAQTLERSRADRLRRLLPQRD